MITANTVVQVTTLFCCIFLQCIASHVPWKMSKCFTRGRLCLEGSHAVSGATAEELVIVLIAVAMETHRCPDVSCFPRDDYIDGSDSRHLGKWLGMWDA